METKKKDWFACSCDIYMTNIENKRVPEIVVKELTKRRKRSATLELKYKTKSVFRKNSV